MRARPRRSASSWLGLALALLVAPACVLFNPEFGDGSASEGSGATATATSTATSSSGATTSVAAATSDTSGGGTQGESSGTARTTGTGDATATTSTTGDATSTGGGCDEIDMVPLYVDDDVDGHGAGEATEMSVCPGDPAPEGYSKVADDCDDDDDAIYPGAPEGSDKIDNDCNGLIDEGHDGVADMFYGGCKRAALAGHFYWVCPELTNPSKAHAKCQAFSDPDVKAEAFHAKIASMAVHDLLAPLLSGDTSFGLRKVNASTEYRWVVDDTELAGFGLPLGAYPWLADEPSSPLEVAIVMKFSGGWGWNDALDSNQRAFICEGVPAP